MTKLELYYFRHIMRRQGSLEKLIMLGKIEGSRKGGRPNVRWIDSTKETTGVSLQQLSRASEDRHGGYHSFIGGQESEPTEQHVILKGVERMAEVPM